MKSRNKILALSLSKSFYSARFLSLFSFFYLVVFPDNADAAFLSEMCNLTNIITGNAGKAFAAFAIVAVGIGFFSGKVSWGLMVGVSVGIAAIFGAPSIVSALSGDSIYKCVDGVSYVTNCEAGSCYSCPIGFSGQGCSRCAIGFVGANCNTCDTGYSGANCSVCSSGYVNIGGVCQIANCTSDAITGMAEATISVDVGEGVINCNAANYTGTVSYRCSGGNFSVISNNCVCSSNFTGSDCASCVSGYIGTDCGNCDTDYTMVGGVCQQDCTVNIEGVGATKAIAPNGSLGCTIARYSGSIDYTCVGGSFNQISGSCILNTCTGGTITTDGTDTIHTFTASGTFSCNTNRSVQLLVVGGGGAGGHGGGGGGGVVSNSSYSITASTNYSAIVGAGGNSGNGGNSSFNGSVIAYGGSRGGIGPGSAGVANIGASTGGGGYDSTAAAAAAGSQGNAGGKGIRPPGLYGACGGGGGAGGVGGDGALNIGGGGGIGILNSITGTSTYYGGGGGGCVNVNFGQSVSSGGVGGLGGGGNGARTDYGAGTAGAANTGGGGGGADPEGPPNAPGGSGVVIVRY